MRENTTTHFSTQEQIQRDKPRPKFEFKAHSQKWPIAAKSEFNAHLQRDQLQLAHHTYDHSEMNQRRVIKS